MTYPCVKIFSPSFLALFLILVSQAPALCQTLQIDRLKANYLVNFVDFVRWNGQSKTEEITIGILAEKDLGIELRRISNGRNGGQVLNVVQLGNAKNIHLAKIDMLYVGAGNSKAWDAIKEDCQGLNILLVGEDKRFLNEGGAIQFTFRKNRLRFYIDLENASSHGIQFSSKLIELALEPLQ